MSDVPLSLQAIKAKLQELQKRQQFANVSNCATPSSTQTLPSGSIRTLEFTDRYLAGAGVQQGTDSLHLSCKENVDPRETYPNPVETYPNPCVVTFSCQNAASVNRLLNAPSPVHEQCILKPRNAPVTNPTCELTDESVSGRQPECESDNALHSQVVTDHEAHMRQIERGGNAPEEWLQYIRNIPAEGDVKPEAFSRAFSGILKGRKHKDESVHLVLDYVQFCSDRFEWDSVSTILDLARAVIQNYAIITVASAEVKILKGDQEKAMSILSKALAKGKAQPKELLIRAIKATEAGQTKLLSEQERRLEDTWVLGKKRCSQDTMTEEMKMPPATFTGFTDTQMDNVTEPFSLVPKSSVTAEQCPVFTHPSSASKQSSLRHYSSTPEMRSTEMKQQWSHVKKCAMRLNLGMPRRVRSTLQQNPVSVFSEEKEDDTDLTDSVKPFNPVSVPRGRLLSSGYHTEDSKSSDHFLTSEMPHKKSPVKPEAIDHGILSQHREPSGRPPPQPSLSQPAASLAPETSGNVMSTPFKGPALLKPPAAMQTPSGAMMETVTVNGDPYFILKKVGRGGSAQVYMVLDNNKNIRALKVVDLEGVGLEVVDGYRNEISVLQRLQYCSCVIKMFSFELNEKLNRLYVVLEFGETDLSGFFATRAKQNEGLDSTLIKFYWKEMLRAVNALHKEGIIHSDLKPANFMLVSANLKLIDFGIANSLQQDKTSVLKDSRVGTPGYMSPEAIMAACDEAEDAEEDDKTMAKSPHRPKYKVGMRSDVWSLGCILYNMVYGRTPFQHIKNNFMKLRAITDPSYTIQFPPISDPLLLDVLQRCLTRDIKLRPTTDELLAHPYLQDKKKGKSDVNLVMPDSSGISDGMGASGLLESKKL